MGEWVRQSANGLRQTGFAGPQCESIKRVKRPRHFPVAMLGTGSTRSRLVWLGMAIAIGALLAVLGPFGSYLNGGPVRLACYWIGATVLGLVLYGSTYKIVAASLAPSSPGWWPALIVATLIASVPEALLTRASAFWLWPELARLQLPFHLWFAQTALVGAVLTAAANFAGRRVAARQDAIRSLAPSSQATDPLLSGDVLALQMEDHYVRVHRSDGSRLLLMPLSRAIACVEADGLRIHRSWWIARHAVATVEGDARSMRVRLSNGVVAPVARSSVTHLKAAGWIADAASDDDILKLGSSATNL